MEPLKKEQPKTPDSNSSRPEPDRVEQVLTRLFQASKLSREEFEKEYNRLFPEDQSRQK